MGEGEDGADRERLFAEHTVRVRSLNAATIYPVTIRYKLMYR
jgi:hypothetical protein